MAARDHYNFPKKRCDEPAEHPQHDWLKTGIKTGNPLVEYNQWYECHGKSPETNG